MLDNIWDNQQFLQVYNEVERDLLQNRRDVGILEKKMRDMHLGMHKMADMFIGWRCIDKDCDYSCASCSIDCDMTCTYKVKNNALYMHPGK
jgi:hypothetical protein